MEIEEVNARLNAVSNLAATFEADSLAAQNLKTSLDALQSSSATMSSGGGGGGFTQLATGAQDLGAGFELLIKAIEAATVQLNALAPAGQQAASGLNAVIPASQQAADGLNNITPATQQAITGLNTLSPASQRASIALDNIAPAAQEAQIWLGAVASASVDASGKITTLGTSAQAASGGLDSVAPAAAGAVTGLNNVANAAGTGGKGGGSGGGATNALGQMESMATRIIERMLIIYALRGTFEFVKGLFDAADALVELSQRTEISITTLMALQDLAKDLDLPFTKVTTAIGDLNKNLVSMKATSLNALIELKLNVAAILEMKGDQQFRSIADALREIEDPAIRAKLELMLLGTTALDPLIIKAKETEDQIKKTNRAFNELELAKIEKGFKDMGTAVKEGFKEQLVSAIPFIETINSKLKDFTDKIPERFKPGFKAMSEFFENMLGLHGVITRIAGAFETQKKAQEDATKSQQELNAETRTAISMDETIAKLIKEQAPLVAALTEEQKRGLHELGNFNILTEQNALLLGITIQQYKEMITHQQMIAQQLNTVGGLNQKLAQEQANYAKNGVEAARDMIKNIQDLINKNDEAVKQALQSTYTEAARQKVFEDGAKRYMALLELQKKAQEELTKAVYKEADAALAVETAELARFGVVRAAGGNIPIDMNTDLMKKQGAIEYAQSQLAVAEANRDAAQSQLEAAKTDDQRREAEIRVAGALYDVTLKTTLLRGAMNDYEKALFDDAKAADAANASSKQVDNTLRGVTTTVNAAKDSIQGLAGSYRMYVATVDASNNQGIFFGGSQTPRQFATGGPVTQTGPAMVHEGEFIVPKDGTVPNSMAGGNSGGVGNVQVYVSIAGSSVAGIIDKVIIDKAKQSRKFGSSS